MIFWKPSVEECLQCVKQPTNKVDKNTVVVVRAHSLCKEEVVDHVQQMYDCIHVSFPAPLRFGHQPWKRIRTEIPCEFLFLWIRKRH